MQPTADISFTINERKLAFQLTHDATSSVDRDIITCMNQFGCPEPEVMHLLVRVLRPGDFAIDGGANVGFFTLVMSQLVGEYGIVLAVEPGENNLPKLTANLRLNKVKNVEVCNRPLWSSNDDVTLYYSPHGGYNSLSESVHTLGKKTLQGIQLSTWHSTPRLIKLDIEGSEEHALRGATKHLVNSVPYIVCEMNIPALRALGSTQESLRKFMRDWGYSTFLLFREGHLPCLVPEKTLIFEAADSNGTVNVLFSTVEKVANVWPRAVLKYV